VSQPRLLLVPWISELEWIVLEPRLSEWAEIATSDPPGVGEEPLPEEASPKAAGDAEEADRAFDRWRQATAERSLTAADELGWEEYVVVGDGFALDPVVRVAEAAPKRVRGIAFGHAALENTFEGDRATLSRGVWDTMRSLINTDQQAFIGYGIAQLTQGAVDDALATRWLERIPDGSLVAAIWEAIGREREPLEERLRELGLPLLLAEHQDCLLKTEQGYEDAVAAFPDADTVSCPEACAASPTFAEALHDFCTDLERDRPWA
jgi:hypothetical protein